MDRLWLQMEKTTEAQDKITSLASSNYFFLISLTITIVPLP